MFPIFYFPKAPPPFITTNDNPIHKVAHRSTDQLFISFSDIGVLPTNYDNKRLHRVLPHRSGNRLLHNFQHSPIPRNVEKLNNASVTAINTTPNSPI